MSKDKYCRYDSFRNMIKPFKVFNLYTKVTFGVKGNFCKNNNPLRTQPIFSLLIVKSFSGTFNVCIVELLLHFEGRNQNRNSAMGLDFVCIDHGE